MDIFQDPGGPRRRTESWVHRSEVKFQVKWYWCVVVGLFFQHPASTVHLSLSLYPGPSKSRIQVPNVALSANIRTTFTLDPSSALGQRANCADTPHYPHALPSTPIIAQFNSGIEMLTRPTVNFPLYSKHKTPIDADSPLELFFARLNS